MKHGVGAVIFYPRSLSYPDIVRYIGKFEKEKNVDERLIHALPSPRYIQSDFKDLRDVLGKQVLFRLYKMTLADSKNLRRVYGIKTSVKLYDRNYLYFRPTDCVGGYDYLDCAKWIFLSEFPVQLIFPLRDVYYNFSIIYSAVMSENEKYFSDIWPELYLATQTASGLIFNDEQEKENFISRVKNLMRNSSLSASPISKRAAHIQIT